jgi:FkbM family methyltransferase
MGLKDALRAAFFDFAPRFLQRIWVSRILAKEVEFYGEAELPQLSSFVRPGDRFLDIGANRGVYTWLARRLGARVIAFEPNPAVLVRLRALQRDGVELREVALSNREGTASMIVPDLDAALGSLQYEGGSPNVTRFDVPTATLDSLELGKTSFIKIDVEGHEEAVIEGALGTITADLPHMLVEIEERHNPGGFVRIRSLLESLGYSLWFLAERAWRPASEFNSDRDQDPIELAKWNSAVCRRDLKYYNNFLCLPPGHSIPKVQ